MCEMIETHATNRRDLNFATALRDREQEFLTVSKWNDKVKEKELEELKVKL